LGTYTNAWRIKINDKNWGGTNYSVPATIYFGLSTTTITSAAGNITEPVGNAYTRVSYSNVPASFSPNSGSPKTNAIAIQFPNATGAGWGHITDFFVCDDPALLTNVMTFGPMPGGGVTILAGNAPNWPPGLITFGVE
jgi:hypothetical protein